MIRHPPRPPLFPYTPLFQSNPSRRAVKDHRLCGASRGSLAKSQSRKVQPFARAVAESAHTALERTRAVRGACLRRRGAAQPSRWLRERGGDRKSTRLNSSHGYISYAVFCLKKKKIKTSIHQNSI